MEFKHVSIMAGECMKALAPERGGIYVDCTAGGGGHSLEIAKRLPAGAKIMPSLPVRHDFPTTPIRALW